MKLLTSLVLASILLVVALAFVGLQSQQVYASPTSQQQASRETFWRFLDTNGDGSGTKNAVGSTYSTTPTTFYIQPPDNTVYDITRLIVTVEDTAVSDATLYGGGLITNGITIRRVSGSDILTYTDGVTITTNTHWSRFCEVRVVTTQLQAICEFGAMVQLSGDREEKLEVTLRDDLSGLTGHYFVVQGFVEE